SLARDRHPRAPGAAPCPLCGCRSGARHPARRGLRPPCAGRRDRRGRGGCGAAYGARDPRHGARRRTRRQAGGSRALRPDRKSGGGGSRCMRRRSAAIDIGGRAVGPGAPCYVIAEAGSNHDGRLAQAMALIDAAAAAGCDAVKFQVFRPQDLMTPHGPRARYLDGLLGERSLYELFASTAIDRTWLPRLAAHCRMRRIHFLATPFDRDAVDRLIAPGVNVPAIKNASSELWHLPLIRHAARSGRPLLLSTGMATMADVEDASVAAPAAGASQLALFQCTVAYPPPAEAVNLRAMRTLVERFGVPVGLSDHSPGTWAAVAAVALGANLVEKHLTLSRALPGPDHPFALEPPELATMVADIRATEQALGDGRKIR